jgi:hypothetical protein
MNIEIAFPAITFSIGKIITTTLVRLLCRFTPLNDTRNKGHHLIVSMVPWKGRNPQSTSDRRGH